jgi:hypothetical protein
VLCGTKGPTAATELSRLIKTKSLLRVIKRLL